MAQFSVHHSGRNVQVVGRCAHGGKDLLRGTDVHGAIATYGSANVLVHQRIRIRRERRSARSTSRSRTDRLANTVNSGLSNNTVGRT